MGYTPKDWRNATTHEGGGDETTPLSAAAIEDLETRVTDYTDIHGAAVSVMDSAFGVAGDGATDDTAGFQSARTAAGVGGHIYVPPNTYILNDVALNVASQTWTLAPGAILKLKNSAGGNQCCLLITGQFVTIDGGVFDGNRANNTGAGVGIIRVAESYVTVRDAYFHDGQANGIIVNPAAATALTTFKASGCTFIDCIAEGILVNRAGASSAAAGIVISDCYADNSALGASIAQSGFTIAGSSTDPIHGAVISDCYSKGDASVGNMSGIHGRDVLGLQISGCCVENCDFGITVDESGSENTAISGCTVIGAVSFGIELAEPIGASVTGCVVDGAAATEVGICVNSATDIVVAGNTVRDMKTTGTVAGIQVSDTGTNPQRVTITGNTVHCTNRALYVNGDLADAVITGNLLAGDTGGGTRDGIFVTPNSTALTRWLVADNQILDCNDAGIFFSAGGSLTLTGIEVRGNTFFNTVNRIATTNVTFDNTCVVVDPAAVGTVASATTTTLPFNDIVTISGTNSITSVTASYPGRRVTLIFTDANPGTFTDGSNLKLAGNFDPDADDTITLVCNGTNWYETGRSVN